MYGVGKRKTTHKINTFFLINLCKESMVDKERLCIVDSCYQQMHRTVGEEKSQKYEHHGQNMSQPRIHNKYTAKYYEVE